MASFKRKLRAAQRDWADRKRLRAIRDVARKAVVSDEKINVTRGFVGVKSK